jgi:S-adenosylmethionine:diacylglycerol 3-amino-3-carboxypropyl transferase
MTLENLESEVLSLPRDSQAALLSKLLEHLAQNTDMDQEIAFAWADEAERRDQAMDGGQVPGIHAEQVFQKVRAAL